MAPATDGAAGTTVDRVAGLVRAEILSGVLAPDTPLREEAAAEQFGVSRHTVRAAFQRLVAEHRALLEELPTRGTAALREHLEHSTRLLLGG